MFPEHGTASEISKSTKNPPPKSGLKYKTATH